MALILIYLLGCVVSYLVGRWVMITRFDDKWTAGYRIFFIVLSFGSWAALIGHLAVLGISLLSDNNKPAKW
jgi:hypothetical protein